MDRMRFSRGIKLFALTLVSLCGLSLWSALKEPKLLTESLSLEGYNYNTNRKSLAFPGVERVDGYNKEITKENTNPTGYNNKLVDNHRTDGVVKVEGQSDRGLVKGVVADILPVLPQPVGRRQRRTILMSYMRSGSTFTGDLFQASPDVMYMYEPLLYTNDADQLAPDTPIRSRMIPKFYKDTNPPQTIDYTLDTLRCNLTESNMRYMVGYSYSRSFDEYGACVKNFRQKTDRGTCSQNVTERCQQSQNIMSKILRLKMWEVDELLTRDPELQIIHLVRDPRGIAMSRSVAHYYLNVGTLCRRMNTDASMSIDLEKKYPGRILTMRYEDLAMSPMNTTRKLFHHAGVKWTPQIAEKVRDLTSPRNNSFDEKIFGTKRKNSSATAFNWRTKFPFRSAVEIQKLCQGMMELYGYNSLNQHSEMLNLNIPSLQKNYTDKYYKGQNILLPEL